MIRAILLVLALLWSAPTFAQAMDQGQAYAKCRQELAAGGFAGSLVCYHVAAQSSYYMQASPGCVGCWTYNSYPYEAGKTCSARPAQTGGWTRAGAGASSCSGGCAYAPGGSNNKITVNGQTYFSKEGSTPTGSVCEGTDSDIASGGDCTTVGSLTQCVTAQGKHCAVASSGKRFCWTPGETGTKVSGNEASTKSPSAATVNNPPVPPKNNGQWSETGTGTASVTTGSTTTTYNVTNHTSNYGTEGQGGGAEGEGEGEGDGDGEGDNAGEGVGTLYEGTDRTVESVMSDFYNAVTNIQFVSGVTAFMTANGGGSCPTFTLPASQWWSAQTFDAHCSGQFLAMLQAMGWVVFAMACYLAVKIAVT